MIHTKQVIEAIDSIYKQQLSRLQLQLDIHSILIFVMGILILWMFIRGKKK